jgi:ribonuclease PH
MSVARPSGRGVHELRPVRIQRGFAERVMHQKRALGAA